MRAATSASPRGGALLGVMVAALLHGASGRAQLPVMVAQTLHAFASCVLTPAIAAISLHLVGHAALGERLGRNARFAAVGNGLAAAVMGVDRLLPVQPLGVPADRRAVRPRAVRAVAHRARAARAGGRLRRTLFDWPGLRGLFTDRRLLAFAVCVVLFHLSNAAMLPLAGAAVTMRAGSFANVIIAACIMVPQAVVALCSPWVGRGAAKLGRRPVLLLGWAALPLRGLLLAVLPGAWLPIAGQAMSGVSGAVFGVMLPLLAADITRGTSHFNLCMGALGLAVCLGAGLSTALGGWIADVAGIPMAFVVLALIGALATIVLWLVMPETRENGVTADPPRTGWPVRPPPAARSG